MPRRPARPPKPRLLDQVRSAVRLRGYARATEKTYVHWIKRYIVFHGKRHPARLGAAHIHDFLAHLVTRRDVAASTQNVALNAIIFLYRTSSTSRSATSATSRVHAAHDASRSSSRHRTYADCSPTWTAPPASWPPCSTAAASVRALCDNSVRRRAQVD